MRDGLARALEELESAETALLSWIQRLEDEEIEELATMPTIGAVLRSVSRAAGSVSHAIAESERKATR